MPFLKIILTSSILIILTLSCYKTQAQQAWDIIYDTQNFKDGPATKLSIDSVGNYFIGITTYKEVDNTFEGKSSFFKISSEGYLLDSMEFEFSNILTTYNKNAIVNDTLYLFGTKRNQEEGSFVLINAKYDTDLNYIDSKFFDIPDSILSLSIWDIIYINHKFVVLGSIDLEKFESSTLNGIALLEFDKNLDSLGFAFYQRSFTIPFSCTKSYNNDLIVATWGWFFNPIEPVISTNSFGFFSVDSLYPLFTRSINSTFLHNGVAIKQYPDSNYIVSAEHSFFSAKNIGVFKISSDFEILDSIVLTSPEEYPGSNAAFGQALDYIDPNAIYSGSTNRFTVFPSEVYNYIRIAKLDSDLDIIWEKFYGGDANYTCYTVKATEDGGCIVLATRFDFENDPDPNHLGTYILKLGPDGILTGIEESSLQVKEVLVYPNPGRELNIATGFNNYSLTLFDINGKAVYNSHALSRDSKHDLSFLPGGLYIYRIVSEKGELLDSGKWVRE